MIRRLRNGERGQAMVEMALVLPLFFMLLFGVIEMGRIGYSYITVSNAARAGVRVATVGATDSEITNSIIGAAPSLNSASLSISITPIESLRLSGQGVTVQVTYPVQLVIPIISNVLPNPVVVSAATVMRIE